MLLKDRLLVTMGVEPRVVVKRWILNGVNFTQAAPRGQASWPPQSSLFIQLTEGERLNSSLRGNKL